MATFKLTWTKNTTTGNYEAHGGYYYTVKVGKQFVLYTKDTSEPITKKTTLAECKRLADEVEASRDMIVDPFPAVVEPEPMPSADRVTFEAPRFAVEDEQESVARVLGYMTKGEARQYRKQLNRAGMRRLAALPALR